MTDLHPPWAASVGFTGAAVVAAGLLVTGCSSAGQSASAVPARVTSAAPDGVFGRTLDSPYVRVTGGNFYVTWQGPTKHDVPSSVLARAEVSTGRIEAQRTFGTGNISTPQAADGSLWALLGARNSETLLRMNPATLAVTGHVPVSHGSYLTAANADNHLSVAGGALWAVAGDRLVRVSLKTGQVLKTIVLPGGYSTSMAGSPDRSYLIVSVADDGGRGSLQRRDPVSGALLASHPTGGVVAATVGGVSGSGVWAAQPTGMRGFVQRYSTTTLAPVNGTAVEGSNGVGVAVANGLAWILRAGPDAGTNYCANPVTGKKLAAIPLPDPARDRVLGIWGPHIYYAGSTGSGEDARLRSVPVPAACRA